MKTKFHPRDVAIGSCPLNRLSASPEIKIPSCPADIISPISSLPLDVLEHIFEIGTFEGDLEDKLTFPLLLTCVSKEWRQAAVSFCKLWSTIVVTSSSGVCPMALEEGQNPETALPWVTRSLQRSGEHSLQILIDFRNPKYWPTLYDEHNVNIPEAEVIRAIPTVLVPVLLPHAYRFKEVVVLSDTYFPLVLMLRRFITVPMPRLETLEVQRCNEYHAFEENFSPLPLLENLKLFKNPTILYPQLRHLTLGGTPLDWPCLTVRNLNSLTINHLAFSVRPTFEDLRRILIANADSLQKFDIRGALPKNIFTPSNYPPAVCLPNLHELVIGYTVPQEMLPIIHSLKMPSLRKLGITDVDGIIPVDVLPGHLPAAAYQQARNVTRHFQALMIQAPFPLHQLEELTLRSVIFFPNNPAAAPSASSASDCIEVPDPSGSESDLRTEMPWGLFLGLTSLKSLTLQDPDESTRRALSTPLPSWVLPHPQTRALVFAGETITHLHFQVTSLEYIASFFRARTNFARHANAQKYSVPMLEEVTMDSGDFGSLPACPLCSDDSIDIWLVTRSLNVKHDDDSDSLDSDSDSDGACSCLLDNQIEVRDTIGPAEQVFLLDLVGR